MRDRISALRIANIMGQQLQVWSSTPKGRDIVIDCCHSLASALELDRNQRLKFMGQVEAAYQDIRDQLERAVPCSTP